MKKILFFVLFSSLLIAQKEQSPRYQLIQVEALYTNIPTHRSPHLKFIDTGNKYSVLKIDTQTGKTWILVFAYSNDKTIANISDVDSTGSHFEYRPLVPRWMLLEDFDYQNSYYMETPAPPSFEEEKPSKKK